MCRGLQMNMCKRGYCSEVTFGNTRSLILCMCVLSNLLTMSTHQHTDHMQMAMEGMQWS